MARVSETPLPGVGIRHDFTTRTGDRLGVITHRTGRRDLLIYDRRDPDACGEVLRLDDEESATLAELLGGTRVIEAQAALAQTIPGLTIDWLPILPEAACVSCTLQDLGIRAQTGVTIVAVLRGGETIPSPGPDFRLEPGDTAVAVGTPDGVRRAFDLLQGR